MISPIRSLCFNDDHETFTIVLPSQYRVFRCDPFGMILGREMEEYSLGNVATYDGYRFLAITGSPSPPDFNSKCIKIFDHSTGQIKFEHQFNEHILTMKLGDGLVVINMHCRIEIWNTNTKELFSALDIGLNVHCPLCIAPDSKSIICSGQDDKKIWLCNNIREKNLAKRNCGVEEKGVSISLSAYNRNGTLFAIATFGGEKIYIFDAKMLNCIATLERGNPGDIIQSIDFSPNEYYIATCSKDAEVRVFDIRKNSRGANVLQQPVIKVKLPSVTMPRICWIKNDVIGVTSLDGDFHKITLKDETNFEVQTSPFLKRSD
ncbi:hypothetical protein TVAG_102510 [Trichomonas vaginalis G3]|uniref:Anaphase-promoting complex subunit 4 WD40 domain-containing protein n=1 Tax=Trichomonas vaginalis (strain ATCC PRA-98 / G3) TaxID=412133 RepID=A2ECV7_TRIV3|nr:phosphatidylinositol-3,5-bisphosphate binding [Trichomonas vaginalis G3]EAY09502.1 hypothetical protein TVAG_102510 [Trichomonas vaginalis G3]KAI5521433.1 phosphatidylinositol-3,5-bisphosphate binding [Trichomonas vaginalis G3]|eukprot:XP_001321725.1 hypothetical protein [Trichomonas vaginalis G3]